MQFAHKILGFLGAFLLGIRGFSGVEVEKGAFDDRARGPSSGFEDHPCPLVPSRATSRWPKWPVAYPAGPYSTSNPLESQIYSQKTQSESALNSLSPYPGRVNTVFPPAWIPELNTERTFLTEPSKNSLFLQSIRGSV